jgi:hypothetical protein
LDDFEIGEEAEQHMAETGLREDAVRYAAEGLTFEQTEFEDEDVVIVIGHDPDNRRLRLAFNKARTRLLHVRPVE